MEQSGTHGKNNIVIHFFLFSALFVELMKQNNILTLDLLSVMWEILFFSISGIRVFLKVKIFN